MIWRTHPASHSQPGRQTVCCKSHGYKPARRGEKKLLLETAIMAPVNQNKALKAKTMKETERFLNRSDNNATM